HTHVWFDYPRQRAMFGIAQRAGFDAVGFLIDCPPASAADDSAYVRAIEEFAAALPGADSRGAVISSLPESLSRATREKCLAAGIVPLQGQREALEALDLAGAVGETWARGAAVQLHLPRAAVGSARTLAEHEGKRALAAFGVPVPRSRVVPVAEAAAAAAQFGQLLVLGAGGVLTELLRDSVSLLPPFTAAAVAAALGRLKVASLLAGYRGRPPADVAALVQTALACTRYAAANLERLVELDLNPVIVRPRGSGAVAVDALIRLEEH